ncbi:hypothetical protein DER44DRAFT_190546 [Fusarium oxysporum]|nr:hypothetical protein DER44DRAFT_190546 [Fusarium oxysporum]
MAELSIHDYVNFSFRLRKRLPYYNGDEHELDLAVESITELLDELKILRDWTCMANELRRGEHKAHRVKRLDEYLQAMFGGKHAKLTEEQKKRFYNLQEAGLITNILTATAIDTRAVKNLSPASIKYICDQGQKFIDRRALAPHLCYFSFYDSLSTMRQAPILSMSCWERGTPHYRHRVLEHLLTLCRIRGLREILCAECLIPKKRQKAEETAHYYHHRASADRRDCQCNNGRASSRNG